MFDWYLSTEAESLSQRSLHAIRVSHASIRVKFLAQPIDVEPKVVCLCVCVSLCLPVCVFAYLFVCLFTCLPVCLPVCVFVFLSACLPVRVLV